MSNDDVYEVSPYSTDKDKNRRNRITETEKDIEKAYEFMDGPGGNMAREVALEAVNLDDMTSSAASFLTDVKRRIAAYNRTHEDKVRLNDHVAIVVRRLLCAEMPNYIPYAALSKAQCDEQLYKSDPERFAYLVDVYGAKPTAND